MVKKLFLSVVFFIFVFLVSGCTVAKGTTCAAGGFVMGAKQGIQEGAQQDWNSIQKADGWVKDNLW